MKNGMHAAVVVLMAASSGTAIAQAQSADEQAIRALIADADAGKPLPRTDDAVQWSGAYKKPYSRTQPPEEMTTGRYAPGSRVPGSQRNRTTPVKIEIARSGDLAYEYSDGELSFDKKSGEKVSLPQSRLRVWKKENGQWKIAAGFSFPHWREGDPPR
jgi:hypothetical protein